jgi:hypothetical protein
MLEIAAIAYAAAKLLSPVLPSLLNIGAKVVEGAEKKVGENLAEKVWIKISKRFQNDAEIESAANMMAYAPDNEMRRELFAEVLARRLDGDRSFAEDLLNEIGGEQGVQEVIGGDEATITRIRQEMARQGKQKVQAGRGANISDVSQKQG